jgi:hypothetical protein
VGTMTNIFYTYYINLDERGQFYADLRNERGSTVYEIMTDDDGKCWQFEEGIMSHKNDLSGLEQYLRLIGLIPQEAMIVTESTLMRHRYMECAT